MIIRNGLEHSSITSTIFQRLEVFRNGCIFVKHFDTKEIQFFNFYNLKQVVESGTCRSVCVCLDFLIHRTRTCILIVCNKNKLFLFRLFFSNCVCSISRSGVCYVCYGNFSCDYQAVAVASKRVQSVLYFGGIVAAVYEVDHAYSID